MSIRIVAVSGGNCCTFNGTTIQNRSPNDSEGQLWAIEQEKREGSDKISIRNKANGQYLRAKTGNAYQQLELTRTVQWWRLEPGKARGSYFVRCTDFKDAYLCNCKGLALMDPNQIYIWPRTNQEKTWLHAITWYLQEADAVGFVPGQSKAEAGKELEKREQEIANKENELEQKQKDLDAKLQAAEDKENNLAERERPFEVREQTSGDLTAQERTDRDDELKKWAGELGEREQRLQEKETQIMQKEVSGGSSASTKRLEPEVEAENRRLHAQIEALQKRTMFSQKTWDSDGSIAPKLQLSDRNNRGGMAPPARRPGQHLPKEWNPVLLQRWEAGKAAMVGRAI